MVKENKTLKEKVAELEKEIENLTNQNKRKERLDIKINKEVKFCKQHIKKLEDKIAKLRKDEQELIVLNVQLMKKIEELCQY